MFAQIRFFCRDVNRLLGKYKIRVLHIWLGRIFWGLFPYRFERGWYMTLGRPYEYLRVLLIPLYNLLQAYSNMEIHYKADIRGGLLLLHASAGCVVSGTAEIGADFTMTGGNIVGGRAGCKKGDLVIGDGCSMGANAVILGPVRLGNNIEVAASSLVVYDCLVDNSILLGNPARSFIRDDSIKP